MAKTALEFIQEDIAEIKRDLREGFKITNGRLRRIEKWKWMITGAVVVLGGFFGWKVPL